MDSKRVITAFALFLGLACATARAEERYHADRGGNQIVLAIHNTSAYLYPALEYQRMLINHLALGAMGYYMESNSGDSTKRVKGYLGTVNFYALDGFRGLWLRAGYGVYYFETRRGGEHQNFKKNGWLTTIGARGKWEGGPNVGVSAGALLIQPFSSSLVDLSSTGTVPLVTFDLGFNF